MAKVPGALWHNLLAVQIYGANTGVGKTVFSTLLGTHFGKRLGKTGWKVNYIKPVSTGPPGETDQRYVYKFSGQNVATLYQFNQPVSPHIAAREVPNIPSDEQIVHCLYARLQQVARSTSPRADKPGVALIETAGGVLSPGPSGTLQAEIFRPLRLPAVLVGDHRLGGIASTISAAESLIMRGYEIDTVVCFDDGGKYENAAYPTRHFKSMGISAVVVPWIPSLEGIDEKEEFSRMSSYYHANSQGQELHEISNKLIEAHTRRLHDLKSMASRTKDIIWHPFTQHKHVEKDDILVFDSAYGDYFQVKHTDASLLGSKQNDVGDPLLYPAFDGSASWWTQGLGHGNPDLAIQAAYAAGRYGHIMFAGATHMPALTLAERMLKGLSNPRLGKVFYSDNGSTATEVGIKMALRASCKRYGWNGSNEEIRILGLKGSYHGDTIGAMNASEPCVFNKKVDWYRGRGYWFDFPTFKINNGRWIIEPPKDMENFGPEKSFDSIEAIFDLNRRAERSIYEDYIRQALEKLVNEEGKKFGVLLMEPVILGAGGMLFVDPLFQNTLVRVVRQYDFSTYSGAVEQPYTNVDWTGLPIMFDEVFTGLYRLGRFSSASFLGVDPDISAHAKLLTGGILPLSITAASNAIFDAFWSDEKADALLHGHSYTAHPIGCHLANVSLRTMEDLDTSDQAWKKFRSNWQSRKGRLLPLAKPYATSTPHDANLWSMWSRNFVLELSRHKRIEYVNALGSVLVVALTDDSGSGYTSSAAFGLRDALLRQCSIHSRVLGNVIYLMASMKSKPRQLSVIEQDFIAMVNQLGKNEDL